MRTMRTGATWAVALGAAMGVGAARADVPAVNPDAPIDRELGLRLPDGFQAEVFADGVGRGRHLVVRDNGDVYVRLREPSEGGSVVALRDEDGDGVADRNEYFHDDAGGTGIGLRDGWLYLSSDMAVHRYRLDGEVLVPEDEVEIVINGFAEQESHSAKAFTFDGQGNLFVNVGAPSNACQEQDRKPGSPAMDPCPLLEQHAGLWRFAADQPRQDFEKDGTRYVMGVRNVVALDAHPETGEVVFVQHGRDMLHTLFPDLYTEEDSARLPAEELHVAVDGANYGWPYTYWDPERAQRMQAPEYGGDGTTPAEAAGYREPLATFPAHWAPNDLMFYTGEQFPAAFRGGAFVALHGSWNRQPFEQQGYKVVFVPFADGRPSGEWTVFADGFPGEGEIASSKDARYRPMGLGQGPDGALYIGDSVEGRIWRVRAAED